MNHLVFCRLAFFAAFTFGLTFASSARAEVRQPTGEVVPSMPGCDGGNPTGLLATFACACDTPGVCNIGAVCPSETSCGDGMHAMCESRMWHVFNDNTCIPSMSDGPDVRADAATTPETFSPTCALTFTVLTRGTARFQNAFGWYNATGAAPTPDDLHLMLACDAAPGDTVVLDVRSDGAYTGGEVGFFLLTPENRAARGECAGGDCCPTLGRLRAGEGYAYYSEARLNPDESGASSFIHLLTYDSRVSERKFYFAWEDTFNAPNNDFTDLVTSVEGVECAGAGADCDTGMMGACATGVTRCEAGSLSCVATFTGRSESCNGLDDDCNGLVDDAVTCPGEEVCHNGECVPQCALGVEFACPLVYEECEGDTGLCVEPECVGVSCAAGEVCRGGSCGSECEGVTCPHGTTCLLDHCVNACAGVSCAAGSVCRAGLFIAAESGHTSEDGLEASGRELRPRRAILSGGKHWIRTQKRCSSPRGRSLSRHVAMSSASIPKSPSASGATSSPSGSRRSTTRWPPSGTRSLSSPACCARSAGSCRPRIRRALSSISMPSTGWASTASSPC